MQRHAPLTALSSRTKALLGFLAVCFLAAGLGGWWTAGSVETWYPGLNKPALTPPGGVFGPVWTFLYTLMALSAFLVWRDGWPRREAKVALILFGVQLALNTLWSGLFFGLRAPGPAFVELVVLWGAIALWLVASWRVSRLSAALIVPYLAWVSFAGYLNFGLWRLNP